MNIIGHTSYLGYTGYNSYSRGFFRGMYHKCPSLKIRNFTTCDKKEQYLNEIDRTILTTQTLIDSSGNLDDFPYENKNRNIKNDDTAINIVLNETNHHYFYQNYFGKKIAYNMWESTKQPSHFFDILKTFDQVWTPTRWQKNCLISQGMNSDNIFVVNAGIESDCHAYPIKNIYNDNIFRITMVGAWGYRKSTKELIEIFIELFNEDKNVELHLFVNNPYLNDGLESTQNRLNFYNLKSNNIIIHDFTSRIEFLNHLKSSNLFLSCAKGEGWNIPLAEALSCGIPSVFSKCSGQLEFIPNHINTGVDILSEIPAIYEKENINFEGNYYLPDFEQCKQIIKNVYENYTEYKNEFLEYSPIISSKFTWENSVNQAMDALDVLKNKKYTKPKSDNNRLQINFNDGAKVEITGEINKNYKVEFINSVNNKLIHQDTITTNMWTKTNIKYLLPYQINITELDTNLKMTYNFDLKNKYVAIINESPSLGDNIAWMPVVDKFQKINECKVDYYTPLKELYQTQYDNINFFEYNHISDTKYYAIYKIGCFDESDLSPINYRSQNLQNVAASILNVPWITKNEQLPKIYVKNKKNQLNNKYVCISTASTAGCKHWQNKDGWQKTTDYLNDLGYKVVVVQKEPLNYMDNQLLDGVLHPQIKSIDDAINWLYNCDFFIGLGSGFSWLSWALNKKVIMISGFSKPESEFYTPYRVINTKVCHGCWNNSNHYFDKSNWNWCPENKNFECTKNITFEMVKLNIDNIINNL